MYLNLLLFLVPVLAADVASTESTPCQASILLQEVDTGLAKIVPIFNFDLDALQVHDGNHTITPNDPGLVPFIVGYYVLTSKTISNLNRHLRDVMMLRFNAKYLAFLENYGSALACLALYSGQASFGDVITIHNLEVALTSNFGSKDYSKIAAHVQNSLAKLDLMENVDKLDMVSPPFEPSVPDGIRACRHIFLKSPQNSSIFTILPTITPPPDDIKIPGVGLVKTLSKNNLTQVLGNYVSTGLNCLENNASRFNFSRTVYNWMKAELIPALLASPTCYQGFPAILTMTKSLEAYSNTLNIHSKSRHRRALRSQRRYKESDENQLPDMNLRTDLLKARERDLRHLYRKLETLFDTRDRVSDLEIIQDGETLAKVTRRPQAQYPSRQAFSHGKYPAARQFSKEAPKKAYLTGSAPAQRRKAVAPFQVKTPGIWFSSNAKLTLADDEGADENGRHLTKIGTEFELDEDTLTDQVGVVVHDDKIQAQLEVMPLPTIFPPLSLNKIMGISSGEYLNRNPNSERRHRRLGYKDMRNYILHKRFGDDPHASNGIVAGVNYLRQQTFGQSPRKKKRRMFRRRNFRRFPVELQEKK